MSKADDGAYLDPRVRGQNRQTKNAEMLKEPWDSRVISHSRRQQRIQGGFCGGGSLFHYLALAITLSLLATVTQADAIRLLQALMSMEGDLEVGNIHPVKITVYRDTGIQPAVLWEDKQCFKLTFDSPYTVSTEIYQPFSRVAGEEPSCKIVTSLVKRVSCQIGAQENELLFWFNGIQNKKLTQIEFDFTNFHNPWSDIEIESISLRSYESQDCSGPAFSSRNLQSQIFYPKITPETNISITSNSNLLGDSSAGMQVTFAWTPVYTTSLAGAGLISIEVPSWYAVGRKQNMMFDEGIQNSCTSPDMDITKSGPPKGAQKINIEYENMSLEKISGQVISITCQGFKNPIFQDKWQGFRITVYDNEPLAWVIEISEYFSFDSNGFLPAIIPQGGLTIAPSVFKIANFSMWVFSVTQFPIPLETVCYIRITIPADLEFDDVYLIGNGMMLPNSGDTVESVQITKNENKDTILKFQGCFEDTTVGPSPTGRLEVYRISTPLARRDTGLFYFDVFKDSTYNSKIAQLSEGIFIPAGNLRAGAIDIISVVPAETGVQLITTYTIIFITENTLYGSVLGGSGLQIVFPASIILPSTGGVTGGAGGSTSGDSTSGGSTDGEAGGSTDGGAGGSTDGGAGGSSSGGSTDGGAGGSTDGGSTSGGSTDGGAGGSTDGGSTGTGTNTGGSTGTTTGATTVVITAQGDSKNYFVATYGTVLAGNIIQIENLFGGKDPPKGSLKIEITIDGIQNPYSSFPAGNVVINTLLGVDVVDTGVSGGSFTPTAGNIGGRPIVITNAVASGINSNYEFVFVPVSQIPKNGFIYIYVPDRLILRPTEVYSAGSCTSATLQCTDIKTDNTSPFGSQILIIKTTQTIIAGTNVIIVISGITNPRNIQPTGPFHIITYDADDYSVIDAGFDIDTAMTELAPVDNVYVQPSSDMNGVVNIYTFTVATKVTIIDGDSFQFTVPSQITLPLTVQHLNITPTPRIVNGIEVRDDLKVDISGQTLIITFITVASTTNSYQWTLSNIKNPPSTMPSESFKNIISYDVNGWAVQQLYVILVPAPVIINKRPATIIVASLIQKSDLPSTPTTYEIRFNPVNPIPSEGSIQITWPEKVEINDSVICTVNTNRAWQDKCIFDVENRTINIIQVFSESTAYISEVTIILLGVINPQNNKEKGNGFTIVTYADGGQIYWIDRLPSEILIPVLDCDYPCRGCLATDRSYCQSCWTSVFSAEKYFWSNSVGGYCEESCPIGMTRDNEDTYVCIPCDVSCFSCKDEDKHSCTKCADNFPYSLSGTPHCLQSCSRGYFQTTTDFTCATCEAPCFDCEGASNSCTVCDPDSAFPVLYNGQCIKGCSDGYTAVNGICQRCESPCQNCLGTVTNCISCDGSDERRYIFSNACYDVCPLNSTPVSSDLEFLTCISCDDAACELCDAEDTKICKRCAAGLYVHDGICKSGCPGGWRTNQDSSACVLYTINDLGIIPFPFLTAAFLGCMIACFGKCKKKKLRASKYSTQNTITCFIVIIASIQFMAIIALIIWSVLFDMTFLFYAACGLLAVLILLNIIFQIFYTCVFNRNITPKDRLRKQKEGKITKSDLKKSIVPSDEHFHRYVSNHGCVSCFIAIFTFMCTFKCNKLYYSHFFSFGMFKARWTQGHYYRKSMTMFCIVSMVIDALIICLCIASLLNMVVYSNMLWVTTFEVAVLSLLLIILGCVELYMMKKYLKYNERKTSVGMRAKFDVSSANDFLDKDSRQYMMKNLLMNVKTNQDRFLNNKLDDLLDMFGDRKCKSMIELGTGWAKEEDPRQVITWPLSPTKKAEYDGEYHFTRDDMIGGYDDNVYADCKIPTPGYEVAVQGDQPQQDFMRQLHRKQGDLLAGAIQEEDELAMRKGGVNKGKRRGRKNKYHVAIDAEDDEEADGNEVSAGEEESNGLTQEAQHLAIIKEQEEEEEQLRIKVQEDRLRQQTAQVLRRKNLAEAERLRVDAEKAEEDARRQEAQEEDRMRLKQDQDELERRRDQEANRLRLAQEEAQAKSKFEAEEERRRKELAALNEANRAKYEAEEAARKQAALEEQQRVLRENEAHELKVQSDLAVLNTRKFEEKKRLQADRDEEELRMRKLMLEQEERERLESKEADRVKLELESAERKLLASRTADEKRAIKLEQERLKREADDLERQRRIEREDIERQNRNQLDEEKRLKRIQEEDSHRLKIQREERVYRERLVTEETERKTRIELEDFERLARLQREEDRSKVRMEQEEIERRSLLVKQETIRLESLQVEESTRMEKLRVEEVTRLEALRVEEETRLLSLQKETEARYRSIEEAEIARNLKMEEDRKLKKIEDEKRAREEEDRILQEKQLIEEEKAQLAILKAQQEAEIAALAKQQEERLEAEARETEARIERERLEREKIDQEKAELAQKKKEAENKLLAEMDEVQRTRLIKEAEDLERQQELARDREAFEAEKRRQSAQDLLKSVEEQARLEAKREQEAIELAKQREMATQMSATVLEKAQDVTSEKQLDQEDQVLEAVKVANDIISEKKLEEEDEALEAEAIVEVEVEVNKDAFKDFNKPNHPVEMPPNADNRTFNVNDILGELDRDNRGNIIVLEDNQGYNVDKTGQLTNIRGYLTNPLSGEILENHTNQKMFDAADIDDKGEVPAPFCIEKFNFNPHDLMGDLDFQYEQKSGRAIPQLLQTKQGFYVDKKGRRVNRFGWLVQGGNGHIVDKQGRKKFDRKQLDEGDLQKLLNYGGKRYDIKDVIGVFDKDANGNIILQNRGENILMDNVGRHVNEKGYLIDEDESIIDREGRKIWAKDHLKNGEPPKIFLFTKFNIDNITGDFEQSPLSEPILDEDENGNLVDRNGRLVNPRGYFIDPVGNIIDKNGKRMFDKNVLTPDCDIPKIFRMQILKTDSGSSLSRLMDEIEKNQPSDIGDDHSNNDNPQRQNPNQMMESMRNEDDEKDGDTSVDSAMEDTPANYNIPNQRFDDYEDYEAIPEESDRKLSKRHPNRKRQQQQHMQPDINISNDMPPKRTKKRTKKKKKNKNGEYIEYLMPTGREVNMADAYGGMAKGQFRRPGVKYDKERLMNRIKTPADIPGGKAQLEALAATVVGFHKPTQSRIDLETTSPRGGPNATSLASRPQKVKRNQFVDSHDGRSVSQLSNPHGRYPTANRRRDNSRSKLNDMRHRKAQTQLGGKKDLTDGDFEKMFGKDIDQYLEGSDFDLDEFDNNDSQYSRGTGAAGSQAPVKLKTMEQMYLKRVESQNKNTTIKSQSKTNATSGLHLEARHSQQRSQKKPPAFREFQDRFVDQSDFIHRGEILEFDTSKQSKSNSRQIGVPGNQRSAGASNFTKQSKQKQ